MARKPQASTRPRRAQSPRPHRSAPTRRAPSRPRQRQPERAPLLSPDQQRELVGVGTAGAGVVLAVILALPAGGSVARGIHDAAFTAFGLGAWLIAATLVLVGVRLCGNRAWQGGVLGSIGGVLVVVAGIGFIGLVDPPAAGHAGSWLAHAMSDRLGGIASAVTLLIAIAVGALLATEIRVAEVAEWSRDAYTRMREAEALRQVEKGSSRPRHGTAELTGTVVPTRPAKPAEPLFPDLTLTLPDDDVDVPAPEPAPEAFAREFETASVEPGLGLGPIPDVALAHAEVDDPEREWVIPTSELLDTVVGKRERLHAEVEATKVKIVSTLASFGIETRIVGANSGPTVTQYELQPAAGVPVRKIVSYQTDLSLALAAPIRIQPFIAGKSAIGIEVPNKAAQLVSLKDVVESPAFTDSRHRLGVALGADVSGHPVVGDLTRMPHMLIAGATGSGKSVCVNALLGGFLLQRTPAELKLILIDPKRVELSGFADLPHLLVPVVVEPEAAVASLRWAVKEMEERYKLFAGHGARNIAAFNEKAPGLGLQPLPYTVIVIDELADLMMVAAGEIEDLICRIAQLARAVGIHLVVATQRPSTDIITGLIKANIPSRVAFAVSSGVDSRVILDEMGAEKLLGRGDMLYLPIDEGKPRRLQGAFVSDRELDALIEFWKNQGAPDYQEEIFQVEATVSWAEKGAKRDPLFAKAAHVVASEGRAAASLLQRKLNVGYTRAARLVDQLAEHRIVGPYEGSKSREVLMDVIQVDEYLAELGDE